VGDSAESLDPQIADGSAASVIAGNCFEGLVRVDENGGIEPGAAVSWEVSPDGLTYKFILRQDSGWLLTKVARSGLGDKLPEDFDTRVTAGDFVFAFRRAVSPVTASVNSALLGPIKNASKIMGGSISPDELGAVAVSDYELHIELEYPARDFLRLLATPVFMPCKEEFFDLCAGRYGLGLKYMLFNGPFYLTRWVPDTSYRLVRNKDYKGEREVLPAAVWLSVNADGQHAAEKFAKGNYTMAFLDSSQLPLISGNKKIAVKEYADSNWSLIFNQKSGYLSDKALRKALAMSFDAGALAPPEYMSEKAEGFLPSFCRPQFIAPPGGMDIIYDETEAKSLLAEAKASLGAEKFELSLLCLEEHGEMLKNQLQVWQKALGVSVTVNLNPVPRSEFAATAASGNYEMAFYPISHFNISASEFFRAFTTKNKENIINLNDEDYNGLVSALLKTGNEAEYEAAYGEIINYIADSALYLPVFSEKSWFAAVNNLKGVYYYSSKDNLYFISAQK